MNDPKTEPAFPADAGPIAHSGLSQYAYVAMHFYASLVRDHYGDAPYAANEVFDHTDAFFAELAKRTKS